MVDLGGKVPAWGLSRWEGAGLRFRPPDDEGFTLRGNSRQLLYRGRNKSHRITILGDSAFEYDCILNREPDSNVVALGIEGAEQFDFFRQPDFIKDPFLAGSYAVYKKETRIGEGTGKLCHIHRPKIIDARGRWVWGDLCIAGDRLLITIPENWLSEAAYPVVVDPTIGTTTVGSQTSWYDPDNEETVQLYVEVSQIANRFQLTETLNGNATAYVYAYDSDYEGGCRPILYSDNNNVPNARKSTNEGYFDIAVSGSKPASWRSTTFKSNGNIASGSYVWFGFASMWFAPRFDYGLKCYKYWIPSDTVDTLPATFALYSTGDYYNFKVSMYFSFTSAQNYTRTITQGVKLTDTRKQTGTYKRTAAMNGRNTTALGHGSQYFRQHSAGFTGLDALRYERGFLRTIAEQIKPLTLLGYCRDFLRSIVNAASPFTTESRNIANRRDISSTAGSGGSTAWGRGFFRTIATLLYSGDTASPFAGWLRRLPQGTAAFDTAAHGGGYIRGLYVEAGNIAETNHQADYYRRHEDTAYVEALSLRHLIIFIKLLTTGFVRDFIIRRFLKSNEDIVLKSCICREIEIDSRIH